LIKDGNPYVVIFDEVTALTKGSQETHEKGVRAHQDTEQYKNGCELNILLDKIARDVTDRGSFSPVILNGTIPAAYIISSGV